jgi:uncharacterized protein (TIGR00299 family) protein
MKRLTLLYFDCASGAAGDMILGALIDAGVPLEDVRGALGTLAIEPEAVWTQRVNRAGIMATKFCVRGDDAPASHDHRVPAAPVHTEGSTHAGHRYEAARHGHTHTLAEEHRTLEEIGRLIDGSALSADGKARAHRLFERLAAAEADIHGIPIDRVHLHEVGALDSIIDVVGTVFALDALAVDRVMASPLNVGSGTVRSAHGVYPVPAPATLRLLQGTPVYAGPQQVELVTPTGALLITEYAREFGGLPPMRPRRIGYGAGSRDFGDTPNVLRVVIGDADVAASVHLVVVIEAEIDDMNPQLYGVLMDRLLATGALDVYYTPIQMKKNRPGTLLTIIAPPSLKDPLTTIVFRESTTIGVRFSEVRRECLERETLTVETPLGSVRVKVARRDGVVMNAAPEFDDCLRLAGEHQRPVKDIQALAVQAFMNR